MNQLTQNRLQNSGYKAAEGWGRILENISRVKLIKMLMRSVTFLGVKFSAQTRGMLEKMILPRPEVREGTNR